KHALVQDVAYASQLTGRREELHRLVADASERHYANQLDAKAALIARHREAGGEPLAAAEWQARAARWISASDLLAAREHWSQTKRLLDTSPSSAERDARLVDCHYELLWMLDRQIRNYKSVSSVVGAYYENPARVYERATGALVS
ncbi:MAG: hypothetical protein ACE5PO_03930, partial [Candidatus Bathyarchaeia archaeon]